MSTTITTEGNLTADPETADHPHDRPSGLLAAAGGL